MKPDRIDREFTGNELKTRQLLLHLLWLKMAVAKLIALSARAIFLFELPVLAWHHRLNSRTF